MLNGIKLGHPKETIENRNILTPIMINFEKIACKPTELLSMTGYTLDEFNALLRSFEEALLESNQTLEGKERVNKPSIYKNSPFSSIADQLFFILTYMKQYATQAMHGQLFGISQPKANLWIHYLMAILSSALDKKKRCPVVICKSLMRRKLRFTHMMVLSE